MKITFSTSGLLVNDQKVGLPSSLDALLEVFGPHDRKVFGTSNIYIYEEKGFFFYNNSNDRISDGIIFSFQKDAGFKPEKAFAGTIVIGEDAFDMSTPEAQNDLLALFTFGQEERFADKILGDYRIFISKKDDALISIGFHKMEAPQAQQPRQLNYDEKLHPAPKAAFDIETVKEDCGDGWSFGNPKGMQSEQWPRAHKNGVPMRHLFTVRVPEAYRVQGSEYIAVSLFYSELDHYDQSISDFITGKTAEIPENAHQGFWTSLDAYRESKHAKSFHIAGEFDEEYTVVWLTRSEFEGETTELPENNLPYNAKDMEYTVYGETSKPRFLKIVERQDDPNAGKMPTDDDNDPDYIPMYSERGEDLGLERFWGKQHFGGTSSPCQVEPEGFTPFYLEFDESLGNANFGGDGVAQLDLLRNVLAWQCG